MSRAARISSKHRLAKAIDLLEQRRLLCWGAIEPLAPGHVSGPDFTHYTPLADNPTVGRPGDGDLRAGGDGAGADIVWVNRLFNDNFASLYGANETIARAIVDRAIGDWERVIQSFNYANGVQFSLTLLADSGPPGETFVSDVENNTGKPKAGTVHMDDNDDINPLDDGPGWYFDPVPGTPMLPDDGEFDEFVAPGRADGGPSAALDFYQAVAHEIGHALGVVSVDSDPNNNVPLAITNFITPNTWLIDPVNAGDGILPPNAPGRTDPGNALYPVNFGGGAVEYTLTNAGSGNYPNLFAAHLYEGPAVGGWPAFPADLMNDGRTFNNNNDPRQLIGDGGARLLRDAYGYTITLPSQINTFYANFDTTNGILRIEGLPDQDNNVIIDLVGADLRVQVNGTSELIPSGLINNIIIHTGTADDTVTIAALPAGIPNVQLLTSSGNDTLNVGAGDIDSTVLSHILWNSAGPGTLDALRLFDQSDTGNDSYFVSNDEVTKPGTAFGGITYSYEVESIVLTANDSINLITVESLFADDTLTLNGRDGNDTIRVGADLGLGESILGHLNAFGDGGDDLVIFDDAVGLGSDTYLVNIGLFQQNGSQLLAFAAERLELRANNQANDIGVFATGATTLNLIGNDGDDDFVLGAGDVDVQLTSNITVSGGNGVDRVNLNDATAVAGSTLVVDSDLTGDFIDLSGAPRIRAFTTNQIILTGSPQADTFTSIGMRQAVEMLGNGGNDTFNVVGHPSLNSALLPRVTVASGDGLDTLNVNDDDLGGARVAFEANDSLARLVIGTGGNIRVGPGDFLLEVTASSVMPVSGFVLDLTDGSFVRRGASISAPFYRDRIASGYAAGAWNGQGIQSSTAASSATGDGVGFARGDALFVGGAGVVDGIALGAGEVLVRYTLNGDTDLNRTVNFDDLLRLAQNYGLSARDWWHGNSQYDNNVVDFDDLLTQAQNYGLSVLRGATGSTKRREEGDVTAVIDLL